jgi:hypothetical protein
LPAKIQVFAVTRGTEACRRAHYVAAVSNASPVQPQLFGSGGLLQQELPMAHLPVIQSSARSTESAARVEQTATTSSRLLAAMSDRDLLALVIFCGIGILVTVNVILRFPDFGAQLQQLALFLG